MSGDFAQATLDALASHIAVLDDGGVIVAVNRAWRTFAEENGANLERADLGASYFEVCDRGGEDGRAVGALLRAILAGERSEGSYEYPCHGPEQERWFTCRITRMPASEPPKLVVAHEDITAGKRAELELHCREEQLLLQRNALIALASDARLSQTDISLALRHITETAARTIDVARVSVWRFNDEQTAIRCLDLYDSVLNTHAEGMEIQASEYPAYFGALQDADIIAADDGSRDPLTREFARDYFPAYGITSMLDAPIHLGGTLFGVLCHEHTGPIRSWSSDEKTFAVALAGLISLALKENERREAEERLRLHSAALNAANNGIVITDLEGTITWANPAFAKISGYALDEAIGKNPRDLVKSGQHHRKLFENLWATIQAGRVWRGTLINRRKDGDLYSEAQSISPIRDGSGNVTHFVAVKEDVTEKLRAQATLQEARERLQRAVTAGNIALWEWNRATGTVLYSAEWMEQVGLEAAEVVNTIDDWFRRVHPEDIGPLRKTLDDCVSEPWRRFQREFRIKRADGELRWILLGAAAVADESGSPSRIIGTNVDITDRKRLELEFLQAQKMESIGLLAGGVAHDFNNLLGVIGGYTELMLESVGAEGPLHENVMQIKRAADRATGLTRQLLAFSRRQILRPSVADLNGIIEDAEKMLRRLIGEDIELRVELTPGLGRVMADPGQVDQILMNLAVNARDAMPGGGRLTIATRNEEIDERQARQRPGGRPGRYACVEVRDSGIGMDAEVRARIFEPFFTTKEVGKGTGLGLATVYGIVKQSGGNIWVESESGKGTAFQIYLPWIEAAPALERHDSLPEGMVPGGETILLAEDEEALRAVMRITLSRAGYTVLEAHDGLHALSLLKAHPGRVDLVLTDVVMPGLNGPDLVREIAGLQPGVKVLFMSGYADDTIVHQGVLDDGIEFINKPFSFIQLNRKVREVLDRR
ncbi:MAG: PAS domain S-box protein [Candidatus Hydrogenedentes bacterium]|nr:PAS domain S-box protein [Candidatus Hydrogenedentota bacterium]